MSERPAPFAEVIFDAWLRELEALAANNDGGTP